MVIDKGLLLKGLGVCVICAGGAATIHFKGREIKDFFSPYETVRERKIEVAGLECVETEGGECSIKNGEKVFVKRGDGAHFELTTLGEGKGKIKRYKDSTYEGEYKFLIEDNDIGSEENKKLEEFETYEIKKGEESDGELNGKEYLFRKTDSRAEIKNSLGLGCELSTESSPQDCTITDNKVGSVTITGGTVTLSISKETDREDYPLGYRFTFKNSHTTENATLNVGGKTLTLKNNSPMDFKIKKSGSSLALEKAWTLESLSRKVGMECKDGYCSPKEGGEILVKKGSDAHFKVSSLGEGKIKVYEVEGEGYNENLKFSIEEKEIVSGSNKLEEFESYEIKKGGSSDGELNGKYYLSRKGDAKAGIKKALGLPSASCELPTDNNSPQDCTITGNNKVGSLTISGGTVTLNISKETDFPLGYKFTFKNTGDSDSSLTTIGKEKITLKKNSPVEFKIKKEGSSLSLEKAWTLEELAEKVGMAKETDGYWFVGKSGMNVKVDTSTMKSGLVKYGTPTGRIKVYSDQEGYSEGLKFTVEKGDLNLNDVSGQNTVQHLLGQFQSFEVVKESDGKWYLSKKDEGVEKIKKELGLECEFPTDTATPKECNLNNENIKKIKFDGLGSGTTATLTGTPKLTIHKDSGRYDYPLGFKFVFSADSGSSITIPSTPSITVKQNLSYEYKIKSFGENNQSLSLERAWTPKVLMENAVGFGESKNNEWTVGSGEIRVKQDSHSSDSVTANGSNNAKIRVYEGTPGYNQGMKFVIEDGDSGLTGGANISKLTKYETYEISKDSDGSYYFTRKKKSDESIRELLGLPETCSMPTTTDCDIDDSALKAIKFEGKGDKELTISGGTSMKLSITKETSDSYPLNYKFTFSSSNGASFTIPQNGGEQITVANGSNTEFKIKVGDKSNLTLVKVG